MTPRIERLSDRLDGIPVQTHEKIVRGKSRDFFWYSPILKERLDDVTAEAVVSPATEDELLRVLAACYDMDIPVTPRGGGTGNYGQAMPLAGGIVLETTRMNRILGLDRGILTVQTGALMGAIEAETKPQGWELRMHPSTRETATIGGFVSGGSGGVGSIRWGMLAEPGNILRVRVATMEATPRVHDLTGPEIAKVHHAYGVTGVITELDMPMAPAQDWVEMLVGFDDWGQALEAGWTLACSEGLWLKQLGAVQAPAPQTYFTRHAKFIEAGDNLLCIVVAPNSADTLADMSTRAGGTVRYRSDTISAQDRKGLPHMHHLAWNHTTLRALKIDADITYLQMGFPDGAEIATCRMLADRYADELINHVEFTRWNGQARMSSLPIVRHRLNDRLIALMQELEDLGCPVWNPHAATLEEGNRRAPDPAQIALKKAWDPKGLLNPGKMIGWSDPDYTYDPAGGWLWPGLEATK